MTLDTRQLSMTDDQPAVVLSHSGDGPRRSSQRNQHRTRLLQRLHPLS